MAGGLVKYRHLSRNSSARQALLRGLVTSLVAHEHIQTTYAKAKEAQRLAEKLITYAKRDNEETRRKAQAILYTPHDLLPKLFGELRQRYTERPGGYTRVLRTEPRNTYDQAPSAILELVDGPRDARFMMTAKAVAFDKDSGKRHTELTMKNVAKVTRYRKDGKTAFDDMVASFRGLKTRREGKKGKKAVEKEAAA
ncbi:ribosomal protein L17 [Colletotrichum higginsianum]|uniref:Large ribosomal subunit protein bL17m n=2 Tax=Colletotrichum higginsianum TaxID=80884 RepID=H1V6W9_COLHI|nr:Ribosomal protein L17 [Colletotrichum higginsianum IMI 349063]OBR07822.1 Ribosomal protein L17 [Colletotrichum higginsianum IMI 349063]TIC91750.1 54S ribosomal protein L8, mitochondrial [Colletotrichum higginsianum]CCF35971.1 ribosomal protein L17 [Colletotrichum higginsianum]